MSLRAIAGTRDKGYRIYIPRLFENGDYILPSRNSSVLKGLLRFRSNSFKERSRETLKKRLTGDFGFSKPLAEVFASRSVSEIKRLEQTVHGVIDSLLLFDQELFITDTGFSLLKHLVRRILSCGTFNVPQVVKMWKSYGNHIFVRATETVTLDKPEREVGNFFFSLDSWPKIQRIRQGSLTKRDLTDLSQLISSRQLPVGDWKVERKALKELELITTSTYSPDSKILGDIYNASRIIGRKVRKAGPGPLSAAHLSLAAAGSLNYTVAEGGRAKEIIDSISPLLEYVPEEDTLIPTPFGSQRDIKGVPRWRTWCRKEPYEGYPDVRFGDETPETLIGFRVYRQGFDEAIGEQILISAWFAMQAELDKAGIPLRVLTITEPGCKARIVTTGPWWLYVLQQALAHVTRAFLASHPSAESGMAMTDQAWQYLYLIRKADFSPLGEDLLCLSSDLKSATDAIPHEIAERLLRGFVDGIGYDSPLVDIAVDLLTADRLCLVSKTDHWFFSKRGVFMGEPLAKTILTLLNLSVEEIAIREYLGYDFETPVQVSWRCFAVAGDDHIATGPRDYLLGITKAHIRAGSMISPDKHGFSGIAVRYCEKILDVRNFRNLKWTPKTINDSLEVYLSCPFVDSIKVRLLSPCSKSNESFNDRNTAVGKASSLGRTLSWMSDEVFHYKWKRLVRDRFFQRMGSLLPDSSSGVYWHLLLPSQLGGLGLWLEEDIPLLLARLPDPTKSFLVDLVEGNAGDEIKRLFRGFTSNISYRGYELLESEVSLVREFLINELILATPGYSLEEARIMNGISDDLSLKSVRTRLKSRNWLTALEVEDSLLRPFLFKEILSGEVKVSAFNTEAFKKRYAKLWDLSFKGHTSLCEETLRKALALKEAQELFYDFSAKWDVPIRGEIKSVNLLEEALIGLPDLKIHWIDIGILRPPTNSQPPEGVDESFPLGEYV